MTGIIRRTPNLAAITAKATQVASDAQITQAYRDQAAASKASAEAAFAVAQGGYAGPLVTLGGYHFTTLLYASNGGQFIGGFDINGRLITWDGAAFGPASPLTLSALTTTLGYTPASAAVVSDLQATAGFAGPLISAGGFNFARVGYDSAGKIVGGTTVDGEVVGVVNGVLANLGTGSGTVGGAAPAYAYEALDATTAQVADDTILMLLGWGQSLALAQIGTNPGDVPVTTTALDPGWSLMFNAGPFPEAAAITSFVDLRNVTTPRPVETAGPRMFNIIQSRLQARLGFKRRMLWAVAAAGGAQYETLRRGTSVYADLLRFVERGAALAQAQGRKLVAPGIWTRHGEADVFRTAEAYGRDMLQFRRDLQEDVVAITGQKEPVRLFVTQPTRGASTPSECGTACGLIYAADRDPYVRLMGPIYYATHTEADSAHPTAAGFAVIGETQGYAMGDELVGDGHVPVRIDDAWWSTGGSTPVLTLRYSRPVVVDASGTISTSGLPASGYDVTDNGAVVTISAVTPKPAALTFTVLGNVLTLGPYTETTRSIRTNGDDTPIGVGVTVDGVRADVYADLGDGLAEVAAAIAARFSGASASELSITFPGATTITASAATTDIRLTLASAPTLRPRLHYATRSTGLANGNPYGARGLVREWRRLGLSAMPGNQPLHHWACVEVRPLPKL